MMTETRAENEPQPEPSRTRSARIGIYVSAALSALFMMRLLAEPWHTHFHPVWPDALFPKEGYVPVAGLGPFRPRFYFAFRPVGYPLFLWLFGRSSHLVVIAQTALYCASAVFLCWTAWRILRSRVVAVLTIVLIVGILTQAKYALWNTQILSESLSFTFAFAAIAVWWRFAAGPTRTRAIWGFALVIAWSLVRDSNVVAVTVVLVPATLLASWLGTRLEWRVRKVLAFGAIALVVTMGYSYASQEISHRADLQFQDLMGVRVLTDAKLSHWFSTHGMPIDEVRDRAGKPGFADTFWRSKDPRYKKYFDWSKSSGRRAYVQSLFAMPTHYRDLFYKDLPGILKADMGYYDTYGAYNRLPRQLPYQVGGPTTRKGLVVWLLLGALALAATFVASRADRLYFRLAVFGLGGVLVALAAIFSSWFGEPLEVPRHAIGGVNALQLMLVIVVATAVDAVVHLVRTPKPQAVEEPLPSEVPV